MSTAFHPQTDGETERTNRTLEQMLRAYVNYAMDNWDEMLPYAEFAYNNSKSASTQITPLHANLGRHPRLATHIDGSTRNLIESPVEAVNLHRDCIQSLTHAIQDELTRAQH